MNKNRPKHLIVMSAGLFFYSMSLFVFSICTFLSAKGTYFAKIYSIGYLLTYSEGYLFSISTLIAASIYLVSSIGITKQINLYRQISIIVSIFLQVVLIVFIYKEYHKHPGWEILNVLGGLYKAFRSPLFPALFFLIFMRFKMIKPHFDNSSLFMPRDTIKGVGFSIAVLACAIIIFGFIERFTFANSIYQKPETFLRAGTSLPFGQYDVYFEKFENGVIENITVTDHALCRQQQVLKAPKGVVEITPKNSEIQLIFSNGGIIETSNCTSVGDKKCRQKFNRNRILLQYYNYGIVNKCN